MVCQSRIVGILGSVLEGTRPPESGCLFLDLQNLVLIIDQIRGEDLGKKNPESGSGEWQRGSTFVWCPFRVYIAIICGACRSHSSDGDCILCPGAPSTELGPGLNPAIPLRVGGGNSNLGRWLLFAPFGPVVFNPGSCSSSDPIW